MLVLRFSQAYFEVAVAAADVSASNPLQEAPEGQASSAERPTGAGPRPEQRLEATTQQGQLVHVLLQERVDEFFTALQECLRFGVDHHRWPVRASVVTPPTWIARIVTRGRRDRLALLPG